MNFEQEAPIESRAELIKRRETVINQLTENEKINYANGGLHEYENAVAEEGIRHHQKRWELTVELHQLNEKIGLDKFSREPVVD